MNSNVKGIFNAFEGTIEADPYDLTDATIDFRIDANGVDTRKPDRDNHLRSADFFDVEKFPELSFKVTKIEKKLEDAYDMLGDFTIKDVTKPVKFDIVFKGVAKDPMSGDEATRFTGSTKINREDLA